jgi:hypothetical protein
LKNARPLHTKVFNVNSCKILPYNFLGGHKSKHITLDILIAPLQTDPLKPIF